MSASNRPLHEGFDHENTFRLQHLAAKLERGLGKLEPARLVNVGNARQVGRGSERNVGLREGR